MHNHSVPAGIEELLLAHSPAARGVARRILRDESDVDDALQESFLRAVRFFETFDQVNARAWLLAIVRNSCMDFARQRAQRLALSSFDEARHVAPVLEQHWPDAERLLLHREYLGILAEAIASLPSSLRQVWLLREDQQLSYCQIARAVRIPLGTVMSRLSRARRHLQRTLRQARGGEAGPRRPSPKMLATNPPFSQ